MSSTRSNLVDPQPSAICHEDRIYWRGSGERWNFNTPEMALRLAEHFEAIPSTDWFHMTAQRFARDLRAALSDLSNMADAA